MGDLTLEFTQVCKKTLGTVVIIVPSQTINTKYRVTIGADGEKECDCPGFKFHRRCKHLVLAERECDWDKDHSPEQQTLQQEVFMQCPKCGGPTEGIRQGV